MNDVYRRFLDDELTLDEAAELLRTSASAANPAAESLSLDALPGEQRHKAAQLFEAAIRPILGACLAGGLDVDDAARRLAPLVRPMGLYALNVNLPSGPKGEQAMARLEDLVDRLADLG